MAIRSRRLTAYTFVFVSLVGSSASLATTMTSPVQVMAEPPPAETSSCFAQVEAVPGGHRVTTTCTCTMNPYPYGPSTNCGTTIAFIADEPVPPGPVTTPAPEPSAEVCAIDDGGYGTTLTGASCASGSCGWDTFAEEADAVLDGFKNEAALAYLEENPEEVFTIDFATQPFDEESDIDDSNEYGAYAN